MNREELQKILYLLENNYNEDRTLSYYTFNILCDFHKTEIIERGQPEGIKLEDGRTLGPSPLDAYLRIYGNEITYKQTIKEFKDLIKELLKVE